MSLVFSIEKVRDVIDELMPLWEAHWKETERYRHGQGFNMDVDRYIKYNDVDYYILYTARDNGKLVGNFGAYISTSMHTQQLEATEDTLFLLPEYRKGFNSVRFVKFAEDHLISRGVVEMSITTKSEAVGKFCEFLGYKLVGYHYSKPVEENQKLLKVENYA
jgi:hypothetical protein